MQYTESLYDPFLPLQPLSRQKSSDEEYVAKIAKSLQRWDRWRWCAVLFYVAFLGAVIWLGFRTVATVRFFHGMWGNQNQAPLAEEIVAVGVILGLNVGFLFHSSLMGLATAFTGFRNERLLVKYFNRLQASVEISSRHDSFVNGS
ncbi:hypothetical protein KOR42_55830 [Thalassoglobus neptunius]|uniref:Uncharacterized protein n=1 Tax=Thalassoglobus neptunius TaxID=1938619 RepID=A0A5C5UST9_9PLAN|nr:hypothetical protein [Thalassoglobus neptunius]TWT29128.1 hypothetical protein KOR42_55830 [Thalassoglobus neptunius]